MTTSDVWRSRWGLNVALCHLSEENTYYIIINELLHAINYSSLSLNCQACFFSIHYFPVFTLLDNHKSAMLIQKLKSLNYRGLTPVKKCSYLKKEKKDVGYNSNQRVISMLVRCATYMRQSWKSKPAYPECTYASTYFFFQQTRITVQVNMYLGTLEFSSIVKITKYVCTSAPFFRKTSFLSELKGLQNFLK